MAETRIAVPERLIRPNPLITATRDAATGLKAGEDGRITVGPHPGVVYMVLSRSLLRRALLIVQAVFSEAERRDWEAVTHAGRGYGERAGAAIVVRGHVYPLEVHEKTEAIPFDEQDIQKWREDRARWLLPRDDRTTPPPQRKRKRATGHLRLSLPSGYGTGRRSNWTEGPRGPLENKLARVFVALEERADEDDRRAEEAARREQERRREQAEVEARAKLERVERARIERLLNESTNFDRAEQVRRYMDAVRARLPGLHEEDRNRISAWCEWVENWIQRADPVANPHLITGLDDDRDSASGPGGPTSL
jgi:hypothetical protein